MIEGLKFEKVKTGSVKMNQSRDLPRQHSYHTPQDYQAGQAPGISIQHASPGNPHPNAGLPGALQSGRPGASSAVTAPSTVPTLPPLQNPYQPNSSSRPATANTQTHSYSRSSPAGLDQPKYAPFIPTPESGRYPLTPNHRYNSSQAGQGDSLYSPLALADVRALHENGGLDPYASTPFPTEPTVATKSNYLAPWPVYAFDWCKWPVSNHQGGDSAGKMALGSYVEDGHNYVGHRHGHIEDTN